MQQGSKIAAAGAGLLALAAVAAGVGSASAAGGASKSAKLFVRGTVTYKVGQFAQDSVHYAPQTLTVRTGGTLTIINKDPGEMEPHTFSVVKKSQLPRTNKQIAACQNTAAGVCGQIARAHGVDPNSQQQGPPPKLVVDVGKPGIDQPGDDVFIAPQFKSQQLKISATPGTTLYYFCVIHPWMQGKIKVVK